MEAVVCLPGEFVLIAGYILYGQGVDRTVYSEQVVLESSPLSSSYLSEIGNHVPLQIMV